MLSLSSESGKILTIFQKLRRIFMGLFKKKKKEDTLAFKQAMAEKIAAHRIRYVAEHFETEDLIVAREGGFQIKDGEFIIFADNNVVMRCKIAEMQASELMSLEGAIITAPDTEHENKIRTLIAYYVYFR